MVGSTIEIVLSVSRFEPALNWNRFLTFIRHNQTNRQTDKQSIYIDEKETDYIYLFLIFATRFYNFLIVLGQI